jgi:hypothetical protein
MIPFTVRLSIIQVLAEMYSVLVLVGVGLSLLLQDENNVVNTAKQINRFFMRAGILYMIIKNTPAKAGVSRNINK